MIQRLRRPSKPVTFALLMTLAAVLALLPQRWTAWSGRLLQPFALLQHLTSSGAREVRDRVDGLRTPELSDEEVSRLLEENERLRRLLGQQRLALAEIEQVVDDLSGLRGQLEESRAKIHFAIVLGRDAAPRRHSLVISRGSVHGVAVDDWVAAGVPPTEQHPNLTGHELLAQQWIVGRVVSVEPLVSHVRLATDPDFGPIPVWTARVRADGTWERAVRPCGLRGIGVDSRGRGRMVIEQAREDYASAGYQLVVVPLVAARPTAISIGRVEESRTLETGLHYDLTVAPIADAFALSYVYVLSFSD